MTDEQTLQAELASAQRALALIQKIDAVRDRNSDPAALLPALAHLLADELQTDVFLLILRNQETAELELKALVSRLPLSQDVAGVLISRELGERILQLDRVTILTDVVLPIPDWPPSGMQVTAVPIIMGDQQRLGGLLLARQTQPFTEADLALLTVAEDHIDSAVIQGYVHRELALRVKELETIYQIDRIRDRGLPFDEMLTAVLAELEGILAAEMGFIMLYEQTGEHLEMRAATNQDLFVMAPHYQAVYDTADACLAEGHLVCREFDDAQLRSVMCLPLILNERVIGVLGIANRRGHAGFVGADQRLLQAVGSQMDTAIFENMQQRRLRQVLGRSVDPRILDKLLNQPDIDFLEGQRRFMTVLYADIRGSTTLAENTEPEKLVQFINAYLGGMTQVILDHEGTLDKFVGDEVMALFGAPHEQSDHALRSIRAGLAMQVAHAAVLADWVAAGGIPAPIGIGIATGELIAGEMGSAQRTDYTVIGRAANLGARICSAAQGGQVLICPETYALVKDDVEAIPIHGMEFKGVSGLMTIYHVTGLQE